MLVEEYPDKISWSRHWRCEKLMAISCFENHTFNHVIIIYHLKYTNHSLHAITIILNVKF